MSDLGRPRKKQMALGAAIPIYFRAGAGCVNDPQAKESLPKVRLHRICLTLAGH